MHVQEVVDRFYLVFSGVLIVLSVGQSLNGYELKVSKNKCVGVWCGCVVWVCGVGVVWVCGVGVLA